MTRSAEDRTLILLRHAKAQQFGYDRDHSRELTPRGHRDAQAAGAWLREQGIGVDEVLCSTSARTVQTAEGVWAGGCAEAEVHYDDRIYGAGPQSILDVVREADADANVVMVVGHAPGLPVLAELLADGNGSEQAHHAMCQGFPTAAMAVLTYSGHWADLDEGDAALARFHVCRS